MHCRPRFHLDDGFWSRWLVSQGAVGPLGVVVLSPALNDDLGCSERVEDLPVQQFVAQPSIEAFDVAVLPWAARLDEGRLRAHGLDPATEIRGDELRAIVAADGQWALFAAIRRSARFVARQAALEF